MRKLIILMMTVTSMSFSACISADDIYAKKPVSSAAERSPLQYQGWAALKRQKIDPQAGEDEWISMRDITITDDGTRLRFMDADSATPYWIELIVITYEQSNTTVLKLALYKQGEDKAFTYIWGEPGTERLGLNLRWLQIGLTKSES